MANTAADSLEHARAALDDGDAQTAWQHLNPMLRYPYSLDLTDDQEQRAWGLLAQAAPPLGLEWIVPHITNAIEAPNDPTVLYELGYQLFEARAPQVGATPLAKANRLAPGQEGIVVELAAALESSTHYKEAKDILIQAIADGANTPMTNYLLAFNSFMSGDVETARATTAAMGIPADPEVSIMVDRMHQFLARYAQLERTSPLDDTDLRGWHYAITGGLLAHVSDPELGGPGGRYAFIQDHDSLINEGVERLRAVCDTWAFQPDHVLHFADRGSEIMAHLVAKAFGIAARPASKRRKRGKTILVAYDLYACDPNELEPLLTRNADELLFSHAMCWTDDFGLTADVSTFMYQHNTAPWDAGRMRVDPETQQVSQSEADPRPSADIAADIRNGASDLELADLDEVRSLAVAIGSPRPGARARYFAGSPVQSSRFF